ncbi:MAG: cysteinyl-tRNA synthetase [Chloroflexi bacterium]|nr:cysteinyl-tRNA synthetase [Chloroflexota bacterium]
MEAQPGLVVLFSSGETSASGRRVYDWLFRRLSPPIRVAVLETPAGFQPNSALVAQKVADFLRHHLQNYRPQVTVIPARKRGTPLSPDDPEIVSPLLQSNVIFLGPGSPTYAVRQLQNSLAWHTLIARHRLGAAIIFASAATIAAGIQALPVYEIYKAGADLYWHPGLDFFGPFGLSLVLVSHWDNKEGGSELDTSRAFIGQNRFEQLRALLPAGVKIVGIDEHTALILDMNAQTCLVKGRGGVTVCEGQHEHRFRNGQSFDLRVLGAFQMPEPEEGIPAEVWEWVQRALQVGQRAEGRQPSPEVLVLVQEREVARSRRDWATADALRERIAAMGWEVRDTPKGPELVPIGRLD